MGVPQLPSSEAMGMTTAPGLSAAGYFVRSELRGMHNSSGQEAWVERQEEEAREATVGDIHDPAVQRRPHGYAQSFMQGISSAFFESQH